MFYISTVHAKRDQAARPTSEKYFFFREINNFFLLPAPVVSTTLSTFSAFTQEGVEFSLVATAAPFSPKVVIKNHFHEKNKKKC